MSVELQVIFYFAKKKVGTSTESSANLSYILVLVQTNLVANAKNIGIEY